MNPGAVLALMFFSVTFGLGLTAAALAARACWTNISEELDIVLLSSSGLKRFLLGMVNCFISLVIVILTSKLGPLGILGLLILFLIMIFAFIGFVAEVSLWGRRVLALRQTTSSLFAQTLAGGLTLSTILLLPFVGQTIFFIILFQGLGTSIYWLFQRKNLVKT